MLARLGRGARRWVPALAVGMVFSLARLTWGDELELHLVRIEEDWELVVGDPDGATNAPQVTTVLSPYGSLGGYYVALELNFQSQPLYAPGGVHLQLWQGDQFISTKKFPSEARLGTAGETVRWTQSVEASDGSLKFAVTDGSSQTWDDFGGQGYLRITIAGFTGNLDSYRPNISTANSGVSFARNRVESLTLKRVRATASNGMVVEDDEPRVVFQRD